MQPCSIVQDRGFKKFVSSLYPRYQPPSRKTITHTLLPQKYTEVAKKVRADLDMIEYVATTTDIWTSVQTKGYITLTSHYITPFWELKSPVLATVQLTSEHTAINIASELQKLANDWEIKDKVVGIVTDNAANMLAAARVCGWTHLSCFAHTLNLVVTDAIKADDDLMRVQQRMWYLSSITVQKQLIALVMFRSNYLYHHISSYKMSPLVGIRLILCSKESSSNSNLSRLFFVSLVEMTFAWLTKNWLL